MLVRVTTANGCNGGAAPIDFTSRLETWVSISDGTILSARHPSTSSAFSLEVFRRGRVRTIRSLEVQGGRWTLTLLKFDFPVSAAC